MSAVRSRPGAVVRRVVDLVLAGGLLLVAAPALAVAAALVAATSPGGALFRQTRIGRNGEPFTILKLRTMYIDADDTAQREFNRAELLGELDEMDEYALADDPRITPVGRVLRSTSLDEFPQLWNVIRGEMALVGPRPCAPFEVELFEPRFLARHDVRPGITGLWQVEGRRTVDMRGMLELDLRYVNERSVRGDLSILVRTVPAVVRGTGAG